MSENVKSNKNINEVHYKRIKNEKYAESISEIIEERLLIPEVYKNLGQEEQERLERMGFVVGSHSIEDLEGWLKNGKNYIIIGEIETDRERRPAGFAILLGTEAIKQTVRNYGDDVIFENEESKDIIYTKDFLYLIQIAVFKKYSNMGIASGIYRKIFETVNKPIISFVVKSPLLNKPSLYVHLKNRFDYFGDYIGEYEGFKGYRSIGLIYIPGNPSKKKKKNHILKLMEEIYSNNKTR